jgi:serine/threonine protein kinase/formylglycine-generating enzyme required for sulfatase activity
MTPLRPDEPTRKEPISPEATTLVPSTGANPSTPLPPTTAASAPLPTLEAVRIPGYEILGVLGKGGMGIVYKARQISLNRLVALKMVLAGGHAGQEELARFRAEAAAVACLQHPNIVQIYEVSEADGRPYFSLEYCSGGSLADRIDGTPWPVERAAALIETLARAVDAAHQAGIVHRDLKPANILLVPPRRAGASAEMSLAELATTRPSIIECGMPKITDFGVAKRLDGTDAKTVTGAVIGTPSYMAPEQTGGTGQAVGPATDTYALGAILYELLTGRPPFKGATPIDTVMQVVAEDPVPPRHLQSRIPRDLETICLKCLHKQPRKRYASAEALADDLKRFLDNEPVLARPTPFWERGAKWVKRRPTSAALVGLSLLVTLGVVGLAWKESRDRREMEVTNFIKRLESSDPNEWRGLLRELEPLRDDTEPRLLIVARDRNAEPSKRLRSYLALKDIDDQQVEYLSERLLDCSLSEFRLVRNRLERFKKNLTPSLFEVLRDPGQTVGARFRAGLALAFYVPDDPAWVASDFAFLAGEILAAGRDDQRDVRDYLRPLGGRLLAPLEAAFHDDKARTSSRLAAADALADLASDDPPRLARLASEAGAEQYAPLRIALTGLEDATPAREVLHGYLHEAPAPQLGELERIRVGRRRAGAAVTLMHLGEFTAAAEVLRVRDDPEAATQFIHGLRDRAIPARDILDCLSDGKDTDVLYGLLLALGEFRVDELPPSALAGLRARLIDWHGSDPRSIIHGASGWLLRTWGFGRDADRADLKPLPYDPSGTREWFVERIGDEFFTFVVFRPGQFIAGSPAGEPFRRPNEVLHRVQLTRPFAMCDRELTASQYGRFLRASGLQVDTDEPSAGPTYPASGVTWPEAILFCHWLTIASGQPASACSYGDLAPPTQAVDALLKHVDFYPERFGYRLPTEAEWEYACRAGTATAYGFGNDRAMLPFYGRHLQDGAIPGGQLRPNRRGLFDMHGNVWEWCYDWFDKHPADAVDPVGPAKGHNRALRGGGWDRGAWHCRSAYRHSPTPDYRGSYMGFRVARTLP